MKHLDKEGLNDNDIWAGKKKKKNEEDDEDRKQRDYNDFMQEIEEDPEMRSNINLYRVSATGKRQMILFLWLICRSFDKLVDKFIDSFVVAFLIG